MARYDDWQPLNCDLIVNAGGNSRRMGTHKALLPAPPDGTPLLLHIIERLSGIVTGQTYVIANDPTLSIRAGLPPSVHQIPDHYPGAGSLGGLATGLARCSGWAMVVACDLPLVNPQLFAALVALARATEDAGPGVSDDGNQRWDAIIPRTEGYPQPLHALYHRRALPAMEALLASGNLRIVNLYDAIRVRYVDEPELREVDPDLRSFFNVNTPADWQRALAILSDVGTASGSSA